MKCFKKWKLNIIKPKTFLGKKDRKIRIRTRIYLDQPEKSSSKPSYRKSQAEIIVSTPTKRESKIDKKPYEIHYISSFRNESSSGKKKDKYNDNKDNKNQINNGLNKVTQVLERKKKDDERDVIDNLKDNQNKDKMNEGLNKLNETLNKKKNKIMKEML